MTGQDGAVDYISLNRKNWDESAEIHAKSQMYNFAAFVNDPDYVSNVVRFDKPLLPPVHSKHIIHLQGHIGTDSLSLARLGAAFVTVLDFSPASLAQAQKLANACAATGGDEFRFVRANAYDALDPALYTAGAAARPGGFDMVYTGIGSLCWLHSIGQWAKVVAGLLRPGGVLFIRDAHPVLLAVSDESSAPGSEDKLELEYSYFEQGDYTLIESGETYADSHDSERVGLESTKTVQFNHGIGETVQALVDAGMRITTLKEHMEVPWNALPGRMEVVDVGTGMTEWRLKDRPWRCPHTFTIVARKEHTPDDYQG